MKQQTKVATAIGAVVAGVTAGYVAGVLTAPSKGSETRGRIRKKMEAGSEELTQMAKLSLLEVKGKVANAIATGEDKATHAMASFRRRSTV